MARFLRQVALNEDEIAAGGRLHASWIRPVRGDLETPTDAKLHGEGDADRCTGTEKVSQCAASYAQLIGAGNGLRGRAGYICADICDVAGLSLICRNRERRDVGYVVGTRVIAIEEIEELRERQERVVVAELDRPAYAQVGLDISCAAKLIERSWIAVNRDACRVVSSGDGEGARALSLRKSADFKAP